MKHDLVLVSLYTKDKKRLFIPSIKLKEYEEKTLVATFRTKNNRMGYKSYYLEKTYPELDLSLKFSGNIFLAKNNRIKESYIKVSLSEEEIIQFIKTFGILDLKSMKDEDFKAYLSFASNYYKILVKEGAVLPIIKEKDGKLQVYYVEEKLDDGMICVPLSYEPDFGLKLKSFEREFLPYEVYITDIFYCELQEKRIKEMLEDTSLKLKWQ